VRPVSAPWSPGGKVAARRKPLYSIDSILIINPAPSSVQFAEIDWQPALIPEAAADFIG
jgi:hypothetical protein